MLSLLVGMLSLGVSHAYAVPVTDGALGLGEWANLNFSGGPYPYYLEVTDPNEIDNQFNNTDISHGILLQELSFGSDGAAGGGDDGTAGFGDDGIYILLEVYAPPPTLDWDPIVFIDPDYGITGTPLITMQGDLLGDGILDPFNIFIRHYNTDPGPGVGVDVVEVCTGTGPGCLSMPLGSWATLASVGGTFGRGSVLEYFLPSGSLGTPPSPPGTVFPFSFAGKLTYDNGIGGPASADDVVLAQLVIPEPGTMLLLGGSLLGLIGFGKFRLWQ
ncbi:MAG: hypothetical protein A3A81_02950 [Omnitrophica bacterium RIFCSPLOWO2_01_FULL_45_10b]|nr:MAG: hypothetical protein A3A81_02950 [Omnitrophica bacterium RIFCSPLOWO2_01_FULL_45_10b]